MTSEEVGFNNNAQEKHTCLQSDNVRRKAKMVKKLPLSSGLCNLNEPDFHKQVF